MASRKKQLDIVSFVTDTQVDKLCRVLARLGFDPCVISANQWIASTPAKSFQRLVLFLTGEYYPRDQLLHALERTDTAQILGVFDSNCSSWDEVLLSSCTEFVGWPCHEAELAMRLQRLCSSDRAIQNALDESDLLEEFVDLNLLGEAPEFVVALKLIKRVARCDATVLIDGETGTGKELVARAIHYLGARRDRPFIPTTCGSIPDDLIENELFGHEKGAFTDAKDSQPGLVVQADGGTLFLDEIDTLSKKAQVALLRFLEDRCFKPLGAKSLKRSNLRIIAATNSKLTDLVKKGLFRRDLLFRLDVLNVRLPPLRERIRDIKILAEQFIREFNSQYEYPPKKLHPETLAWMQRYDWPGNVRELENIIHRYFLLTDEVLIRIPDPAGVAEQNNPIHDCGRTAVFEINYREAKNKAIAQFEKDYLSRLMAEAGGNISEASRLCGKERSALGKLFRKHGLPRTL